MKHGIHTRIGAWAASLALIASLCQPTNAETPPPAPSETAFLLPVDAAAPQDEEITLRVAINDIYCTQTACECIAEVATRKYDGVIKELATRHKIRLVPTYFMEIMEMEKALKQGEFEAAICKPWSALHATRQAKTRFSRVADVLDPENKATLWGIVVVPAQSTITTLDALTGKRLALGQPDSYEKHHAPLQLFAQHNVKPASIACHNSCGENLDDLMSGKVDAAVISDYALSASCAVDFAKPEDFRIIAKTREIPLTSVMVDLEKVPAARAARLRQALVAISGDALQADFTSKGFTAPAPWTPLPAPASPVTPQTP